MDEVTDPERDVVAEVKAALARITIPYAVKDESQRDVIERLRVSEEAKRVVINIASILVERCEQAEQERDRLKAENERLESSPTDMLRRLTRSLSYCDDCEAPACDDAKPEGPHVLCHDCAVEHKAVKARHEQDIEAAFLSGFQQGINSVDRYGETDETPDEALARFRAGREKGQNNG